MSADERAVGALARRVMGAQARGVVFEQVPAQEDCYELLQKGDKVLIRGNNANSMAVGLNRYIQEYCLADVSWYHYNPVELPAHLPWQRMCNVDRWQGPLPQSWIDEQTMLLFHYHLL